MVRVGGWSLIIGAVLFVGVFPAWFHRGGVLASASFFVGALRNLTGAVRLVADLNNFLIPVWFGVVLLRFGRAAAEKDPGISR